MTIAEKLKKLESFENLDIETYHKRNEKHQHAFFQYLKDNRQENTIRLFFDIETYQYNEQVIKNTDERLNRPTLIKNRTYSVAVGWIESDYFEKYHVHRAVFPNFKHFFDTIFNAFSRPDGQPYWKGNAKIQLIAHNNSKYDNHYLLHDLQHFYPEITVTNLFLTNAIEQGNETAVKIKEITKKEMLDGIFLEKRVKSSINLDGVFYKNNIKFELIDNYLKTNVSIKTLGIKLQSLGVIQESELKTDFDYLEFNKDYDMTDEESRQFAHDIFYKLLTAKHFHYIENDVIILAKSVVHYSEIFKGFDYSKFTFTSNVLDTYNTNPLTSFQLLNRVGFAKERIQIKYTDYKFDGLNFYDYLKPFYKGGLNFYNEEHLNEHLSEPSFSMDLKSSYPHSMFGFKIPTYLKSFDSFEYVTYFETDHRNDDVFQLYKMRKQDFDEFILLNIDSKVICKMLVKYYSGDDYININSYTLRLLEKITPLRFDGLPVISACTFDCVHFGNREQLEKFYYIKEQAKSDKKIIMKSPYDMRFSDEKNTTIFTEEEIYNAKVNMNGLYGIPALRPYFNLFRRTTDFFVNIPNGFENAQRNIVFSIFVTAVSLFHLLEPFEHFTHDEIDENFLYCDTDSLKFFKKVRHKLPDEIFHDLHLGKWEEEETHIFNMKILNHKKYCYERTNKKTGKREIIVKCAGVPNDAFNTNMTFEQFIESQFFDGAEINSLKSIYTTQHQIALYQSITKMEVGKAYYILSDTPTVEKMKQRMFEDIKQMYGGETIDALYIESNLGTFSMQEIYDEKHTITNKEPLIFLQIKQDEIRNYIRNWTE